MRRQVLVRVGCMFPCLILLSFGCSRIEERRTLYREDSPPAPLVSVTTSSIVSDPNAPEESGAPTAERLPLDVRDEPLCAARDEATFFLAALTGEVPDLAGVGIRRIEDFDVIIDRLDMAMGVISDRIPAGLLPDAQGTNEFEHASQIMIDGLRDLDSARDLSELAEGLGDVDFQVVVVAGSTGVTAWLDEVCPWVAPVPD